MNLFHQKQLSGKKLTWETTERNQKEQTFLFCIAAFLLDTNRGQRDLRASKQSLKEVDMEGEKREPDCG